MKLATPSHPNEIVLVHQTHDGALTATPEAKALWKAGFPTPAHKAAFVAQQVRQRQTFTVPE